jgi:hypothetical protein
LNFLTKTHELCLLLGHAPVRFYGLVAPAKL